MAKTGSKIKVPIILMAWPFAGILLTFLVYMIVNFALASSGIASGSNLVSVIINIILFVVGASSIVLGIPSFVIGLVLLVLRLTPTSSTSMGLGVAGMVLGIASIVSSFFIVGAIVGTVGICLSAAALKRRSAGKGMAITGLITSIVGVFIGLIFTMLVAIAAIASYSATSDSIKSSAVRADATQVSAAVQNLYASNGEYPTYIELINNLSGNGGIAAGINGLGNDGLASKVGMYGSLKDIEYIPCYGDGGMVWYWDFVDQKYITIDYGDTSSCQY
jgi:hypothetical protein